MLVAGTEGKIEQRYLLSKEQINRIEADFMIVNATLPKDICPISSNFFSRIKCAKSAEFFTVISILCPLLVKVRAHPDIVKLFDQISEIIAVSYSRVIDKDDIKNVKLTSEEFVLFYEKVFGAWNVTINTHNILHVHEILENWGPLLNYHLFFYESMNHFFSKVKTSNRKTMDMEILKFCTRKNFKFFSMPPLPDNLMSHFFDETLLYNLKNIPKIANSEDINKIYNNHLNSLGNEPLPEGSHFIGLGHPYILDDIDVASLKKLFGNASIDFPLHCVRFYSFRFGDAVYSCDPKMTSPLEAKAGCLVGTMFCDGNDEPVEYLTQICSFLKYVFQNSVFYLMQVRYWRPRAPSGLLASRKGLNFFEKSRPYVPSRDCVIPINRIYSRFTLIDNDVAVELDRKLRA